MASSIRFDPRIFIGPPFRSCPACGAPEFGTLMVSNRTVSRRCRSCWHTETERLPAIRKKVVYLDQMAYSNMAKTLDPVWAAKRGPQAPLWSRLFDALERAFKLHLIVCPKSVIHEKESVLAPQPTMIRALYDHLGNGVEFEHPVIIHQHQLTRALRAAFAGGAADYAVARHSVLSGDPDAWMERIRVSVNMVGLVPDPQVQREVKTRSSAAMAQWFERWKNEKGKAFDDWYRFERQGHAINYRNLFLERAALMNQVMIGAEPFSEDVWNPRLEADVITVLLHVAGEAGHVGQEALRLVLDFLFSDAAFDAPANDISAMMMAALARKAASGQQRPPSPGMWSDITAIASFLPYCDAMFVDNECAGLLGEEPLRTKVRAFGTKLFSARTGEAFLEHLADLERLAGDDHVRLVARIYGDDWSTPFRDLLIHERARQARPADR